MKQSKDELNQFYTQASKWGCRSIFFFAAGIMSYVATRSSYNFAHWVPHNLFRKIGIPYNAVLWAEQNADVFLHFFGAALLTLLIFGSRLPFFSSRPLAIFIFVVFLCVSAEGFQYVIGRGAQSNDLLLGILGSFMAYSTVNKKN